MRDTRLNQAMALMDDARSLLVDVVDSRPADANLRDFNYLDSARQFINSALVYVMKADEHAFDALVDMHHAEVRQFLDSLTPDQTA